MSSVYSLLDIHSGKLLFQLFVLMAVSFYAGTLFSTKHGVHPQDGYSIPESSLLGNKVALAFRGNTVRIPAIGVNICPLNYSEYIPCHDAAYISKLTFLDLSKRENFERRCPSLEERPFCLIPPPRNYKIPIKWPTSREYVWQSNVNHSHLAEVKGGQNWVHPYGKLWWFPGGGTHFKHGASEYIERIGSMITNDTGDLKAAGIEQVLDVGCGVASFSGYLLPLGIRTMSFAPKDGHESQIQFALERGIGAMIAVLGTTQLPYPSNSFDMVHCSRCRVDWHENDGILLKEVDRLLRMEGYFVYSAPPAYRKDKDFPVQWEKIMNFTDLMCWKLIARRVQTAVWFKSNNKACLLQKKETRGLDFCEQIADNGNSWKRPLKNCLSLSSKAVNRNHVHSSEEQLSVFPEGLMKIGITEDIFKADTLHWKDQITEYWNALNVSENDVRNVLDMNSLYGGFAAALVSKPVWVMNVVPSSAVNTLPAIYDRGLIGTFHDWCEPFSTYPRTYDLLHAFHLFSHYEDQVNRCQIEDIMLEVDRILRPLGYFIVKDSGVIVAKILEITPKFLWDVIYHDSKSNKVQGDRTLICQKKFWITS